MDAGERNRLYWRSRRGMVELDLRLVPFIEARGMTLARDELDAYARLLDAEDWQIFDWLQGRDLPAPGLEQVVAMIRAFNVDAGTRA
jgi:antitoxin CptB